ncbi:MAG: trypsin-like peptidase domain-containing protein [Planctomycetota bacterium]
MIAAMAPVYENGTRRFATLPIIIILAAVVGVGAFAWARFGREAPPGSDLGLRPVTPRGELADFEKTTISVFERSLPSVAGITTRDQSRRFGSSPLGTEKGSGTGIVWDHEGHIITNYHVIERDRVVPGRPAVEDRITVQLATMAEPVAARVTGVAPEYDLAVLRVEVEENRLVPITVGTSGDLRVGQTVLAIGNPFGLPHTLTTGVVSQLNRRIRGKNDRIIEEVIQTDAAINPGNSGGPLIDTAGRLIGVNSAIYAENEGNLGIGFAIPVDTVNWVAGMLIRYGRIVRPDIGIDAHPANMIFRNWRGPGGLYVRNVEAGGPAEKAGLRGWILTEDGFAVQRHGDVITQADGHPIGKLDDLNAVLEAARDRPSVALRFERDGKVLETEVSLEGALRR